MFEDEEKRKKREEEAKSIISGSSIGNSINSINYANLKGINIATQNEDEQNFVNKVNEANDIINSINPRKNVAAPSATDEELEQGHQNAQRLIDLMDNNRNNTEVKTEQIHQEDDENIATQKQREAVDLIINKKSLDEIKQGGTVEEEEKKEGNILTDIKGFFENLFFGGSSGVKQTLKYTEIANEQNFDNYKDIREQQYLTSQNVSEEDKASQKEANNLLLHSNANQRIQLANQNIANNETLTNTPNSTQQETNLVKKSLQDSIDQDTLKSQENIANASNQISQKLMELAPSLGQMSVGWGASVINPILGISYFTTSAGGSYVDDAKERGMNEEQAFTYGTIMGAMEGITEQIGISKLMKGGKALSKGAIKEALKNYGLNATDNFIQEALIEPVSEVTATIVGGKDKANWEDITDRMLQAGIDGALSALIMDGASAGINSSIRIVNKIRNNEDISQREVKNAIQDISNNENINVEDTIKNEMNYQIQNNSNTDNYMLTRYNKENDNLEITDVKGESISINNSNINIAPAVVKVGEFYNVIDANTGLELYTTTNTKKQDTINEFVDRINNLDNAGIQNINNQVSQTRLALINKMQEIENNPSILQDFQVQQNQNSNVNNSNTSIQNSNEENINSKVKDLRTAINQIQNNSYYNSRNTNEIIKTVADNFDNVTYTRKENSSTLTVKNEKGNTMYSKDIRNNIGYSGKTIKNILSNVYNYVMNDTSNTNNNQTASQPDTSNFYNKQGNNYTNDTGYAVQDIKRVTEPFSNQVSNNNYDAYYDSNGNIERYIAIEEEGNNIIVNQYDNNDNVVKSEVIPSENGRYKASDIQDAINRVASIYDENRPIKGQQDIEGNEVKSMKKKTNKKTLSNNEIRDIVKYNPDGREIKDTDYVDFMAQRFKDNKNTSGIEVTTHFVETIENKPRKEIISILFSRIGEKNFQTEKILRNENNLTENIMLNISITKKGINESLNKGVSTEKLSVIPYLDTLIKTAPTGIVRAEAKQRSNINEWYYLYNTAKVNDELYGVKIDIRKTPQGDRFYVHRVNLIHKEGTSSQIPAVRNGTIKTNKAPSSKNSIPQNRQTVKNTNNEYELYLKSFDDVISEAAKKGKNIEKKAIELATNLKKDYQNSIKGYIGKESFSRPEGETAFSKEHSSDFDTFYNNDNYRNLPIKQHITDGSNEAIVTTTEQNGKIFIDELYVKNQNEGYGTKIIEGIKKYAKDKKLIIETSKELSTAKSFWDKVLNRESKNTATNKSMQNNKNNTSNNTRSMKQNTNKATDSEGRTLTKQQQEYFKESKVRDDDGNLQVVYHGTNNFGFTEFKRNVNFYTSREDVAKTYTGNNGIYRGYLDIKKPIVIDANREIWSMIDTDNIKISGIDNIREFLQEQGASVWEEKGKIRTSTADLVQAISDAVDEGQINADGIIIQNIYDEGGYSDGKARLGTDYITFKSNQFKNLDNSTPTSNSDIRYMKKNNSRSNTTQNNISNIDNQGRTLSRQQQEYFKHSKVRDHNGNLLVVYHGTNSNFSIFDESTIGTSHDAGWYGDGFYFATHRGEAEYYTDNFYRGKPRIIEAYLDIKNPYIITNLKKINNVKIDYIGADNYAVVKNLIQQFPELRKEQLYLGHDSNNKSVYISYEDFVNEIENIYNNLEVRESEKPDGSTHYFYVLKENDNETVIYPPSDYNDMETKLVKAVYYWKENNNHLRYAHLGKWENFIENIEGGFKNILIKHGYDGIIDGENAFNSDEIVAFYSSQIKNITNSSPTSNSDIRFAKKSSKTPKVEGEKLEPGQTNAQRESNYIEQEIQKIEATGNWDDSIPVTKMTDIRKTIENYLGLGVQKGHFRQQAYGIYKGNRDVIRTKELKDIDTILHETGHALDIGNRIKLDKESISNELLKAVENYGGYEAETREVQLEEGFAEVIREYTIIPEQARIDYPQTVSVIEGIRQENKDFDNFIKTVQQQTYNYIHQNPRNRGGLSNQSIGERTDKMPLTPESIKQTIIENAWDSNYSIKRAVQVLQEKSGNKELRASENAYLLTRLTSGIGDKVTSILANGYINESGNKLFPGLSQLGEILNNDIERFNDLRAYLVAQRDLEYKAKGLKTGIRTNDAKAIIEQFKNDTQIQEASKVIYDTLDGVLQYAVDNKLITLDNAQTLRESNVFYVPMQRVIGTNGNNVGRKGAVADIIKTRTGSELDIKDVLENIVANSANIIQQVENNKILNALYTQGENAGLTGSVYDEIDPPMKKVGIARLDMWQNELKSQGVDIDKIDFDKTMDIFVPNNNIDERQQIVSFIDSRGQRRYLQFKDEILFKAMTGLDRESMSRVLNFCNTLNKPLRYGATLANLGFALPNMLADTVQASIYSEAGFIPLIDTAIGALDVLAAQNKTVRNFMNKVAPEYVERINTMYELYLQSGATSATKIGQERKSAQRLMKDIYGTKDSKTLGINDKFVPLKRLLDIMTYIPELSEQSTRFRVFEKNLEYYRRNGMVEIDARMEAAIQSRDATQDFSRMGKTMREVNKVIPFSAARVGSAYTFAEKIKANPKRTSARIAIMLALNMALKGLTADDDEINELNQRKKDDNFVFKIGEQVITIKKPQGFLRSLINLNDYIVDLVNGNIDEGKEGERLQEWIFNAIMDNSVADDVTGMVPSAITPLLENKLNKDLYYNSDIVKSYDLELPDSEQYYDYNSQLAIWLGKIFNYSPAKIDNFISGYFAGLGTQVTNIIDWAVSTVGITPKEADMGLEGNSIGKRFFVNVNSNSASVDEIYTLKTDLTKKKNGGTITTEEEQQLEAITNATSEMAKLNKQIKEIKKDLTKSGKQKADEIKELQRQKTDTARQALGKDLLYSENETKIESTRFYPSRDTLSKNKRTLTMNAEMKKEYEQIANEYYNGYASQGLYSEEKLQQIEEKAKDYAKNEMIKKYKSELSK